MLSEMLSYICSPLHFYDEIFFGIAKRQNYYFDEQLIVRESKVCVSRDSSVQMLYSNRGLI